jgi:hypothetical protein
MSEDEIAAVRARIANGENVIFGDGVLPDDTENNHPRWRKEAWKA